MSLARVLLVGALCAGWQAGCAGPPILTPKPGPAPEIHGPKRYGARPGRPFLYRVPCTGLRPIHFSARGLPRSLRLDRDTGIITGTVPQGRGEFAIELRAINARGSSARPFRLVVGDALALTPPMGWNHWYTHYNLVSEEIIRQAADAMISSGMADFGYQYVNIDGCWARKPGAADPVLGGEPRDAAGVLRPNGRFGDMKALAGYIHAKGLKAGIYSSPGPVDCTGHAASWGHEEIDARTFAAWGFDFLKYDLCSYGRVAPMATAEDRIRPYRLMGRILQKLDRDIVFNFCQYGGDEVWKWAADIGGQCWRTTHDLGMEKATNLPGFYNIGFKNAAYWEYAGPGRWNDPDYILIGVWGNAIEKMAKPAKLTPEEKDRFQSMLARTAAPTSLTAAEQYSYMSMWALMAAPLIFSGDMARLDEFTLNVLCNAEVIDVDQDPLGKQARIVRRTSGEFVLAKPLEDGSVAVGLFNLTGAPRDVAARWPDLGIKGSRRARDLWRQKDIGSVDGEYTATVEAHGVSLVRLCNP